MKLEGWQIIDESTQLLWHEYEFAKGARAITLVLRGVDGLVVVSPATGMSDRGFDALAELGEVRALVANNSFHHMGQKAWRARFPNALSYCPKGAIATLNKKSPGCDFRALEELKLPAHVRIDDPPGFKTGDALLSIQTGKGAVWYSSDLLTNIVRLPKPPIKWLFTWTDSAPGFRLFKPATWILIKDKKAVREWALDRLLKDPPSIVVPGHGAPVETGDVTALAKAQIERL
jgi:hypothetical protein